MASQDSTSNRDLTKKLQELKILDPSTLQEIKTTMEPVLKVAVDAGVAAKDKVAKAWENREERVRRFEQWRQEMAAKSFEQHTSEFRAKMELKFANLQTYISTTPLSKQLQQYSTSVNQALHQGVQYGQQKFTEFEQFSGTALPAPDPRVAEMRSRLKQDQAVCAAEVASIQSTLAEKQKQLASITKDYEEKGLKAVNLHEDMLQFKYLVKDIATSAVEQQEDLEELVQKDMKQYLYQAKESAAHMAMVLSLVSQLRQGVPYKSTLTGMMSFEQVSSLTFPSMDPSTLPAIVGRRRNEGIPTKADVHSMIKKLRESASGLKLYLPEGGLLGDLLTRYFGTSLASEDSVAQFCLNLEHYLWQEDYPEVRQRVRAWQEVCRNDTQLTPESRTDYLAQLTALGQSLDAYLAGMEFQRYLKVRMVAHQKAFFA